MGLLLAAASAALWWYYAPVGGDHAVAPMTPFGDPGMVRHYAANQSGGVHTALVIGGAGVLALILFVGGAIGGGASETTEAVALQNDVQVIDRSRDIDPSASSGANPAADAAGSAPTPAVQYTQSDDSAAIVAARDESAQSEGSSAVRPIVVAQPEPATPVELQESPAQAPAEAAPRPAVNHVRHQVVAGDTIYDIALTYGSTVEAIVARNQLPLNGVIH